MVKLGAVQAVECGKCGLRIDGVRDVWCGQKSLCSVGKESTGW
jgi:hypothetical protein